MGFGFFYPHFMLCVVLYSAAIAAIVVLPHFEMVIPMCSNFCSTVCLLFGIYVRGFTSNT